MEADDVHHISLYNHLEEQELIPFEGCSRGSIGTKDQLLIDKAVLRSAKRRHKNLEMVWVDYKKAYDFVPHSWIIASLENIKAQPSIVGFMKRAMSQWRTELRLDGESCGHSEIKRGIFQGRLDVTVTIHHMSHTIDVHTEQHKERLQVEQW
ncbi:uncharacterized protein LOC116307509 [Actinia tenebrosa]|uniref:Uncharacterized protein LOC116307509 n=1 Tax=Actinia tenebrosa TaxID=6105 RepID=A0A6P8J242_ACTTE|nr:uncharacterized protein LOC116307509 [Actinia tenebrosa]